jgi:hypothetical protein
MHLNLHDVKGVGILPEFPLAFAFIDHCKSHGMSAAKEKLTTD